jgi:hypothetical protein
MPKTKPMTKAKCSGCENDFYNGNNNLGVAECWGLKTAKVIKRKQVPLDQRPPWTQAARPFPDCYRKKGYVFINGDREC